MTLGLYLTRLIGARILAVLLGFVVLGLSFDMLENSTEIIDRYGVAGLGLYALLRAPLVLLTVLPLGVLFGALLGFFTLAARSEMVVIRGVGYNTLRVLLLLAPFALATGVLHNQLAARLAPAAEQALVDRFPDFFDVEAIEDEIWLREWDAVVRIGRADEAGSVLADVSIFELAPSGKLTRRIDAKEAHYAGEAWRLESVTVSGLDKPVERLAEMRWRSHLTPIAVVTAARRPELAKSADIRAVLSGTLPAVRGTPFYAVQLWRSYAAFLVPAVMILFAAMASFGLTRSGGGARYVALGVAGGALFVLVDGVFTSLGEVGAMQAMLAALLAPAIFFVLGLWSIVLIEE